MSAATPTSACTPMTRALRGLLDRGDRLVERLLAARDDGDVGAGLRKARRDREADALAAAGDDGGTARKTDFHEALPRSRTIGTALFLALSGSGGKGHPAFFRATMRWIFLPDDALIGSSSSSVSARAVDRLADQRALEGRVEPAVRVALVGAVGDAPAQIKNSAGLEDGEQAAHRVENLRPAQMHDHGLAQHVVEGCIGHAGQAPAARPVANVSRG